MKRIIIHVYGYVQGVFFRFTTRKVARNLGLTGIVKNLPDGGVYIEAEGSEDKLTELLKFAKKGPKAAEVRNLEYEYKETQHKFKGFEYSF
ncbi:MAG: acylphosphatase [Promethearchaeota archaeon]|jgi:acylphosphatase